MEILKLKQTIKVTDRVFLTYAIITIHQITGGDKMNLIIFVIIALLLLMPSILCLFCGGIGIVIGIAALLVWFYLLGLVVFEYRECKKYGCDEEEST